MSKPATQRLVDEPEYLAAERDSDVRHEYVDGLLFAMTGASRAHNAISANLVAALRPRLRGSGCRVAASDMKVRAAEGRRYYYPDLVVSCGDAREEPDDYTETRPVLLVEILSRSTEQTDRREKLVAYRGIDSVVDYLIVSQAAARCERYTRVGGDWTRAEFAAHESVELVSVGLSLTVAEIYEDVTFDEAG